MHKLDLETIRSLYRKAVNEEASALDLWSMLEHYVGEEGIFWAYKASARALMANYDWNPVQQLWYINECMKWFRKGVKRDPLNIEIRFLRFAVQHYTPGFLNLSQHLDEDKAMIMTHFDHYRDFHLKEAHMLDFLRFFEESERFSQKELDQLKTHIKQ